MSISIADFWRLLGESRLLAPEQVQQLAGEFGQLKGAGGQASGKSAAEWLVSRNVLSRYQATILQAGRAGPFYYGDYKVYDRVDGGRLAGGFRAVHAPTGHPVLLRFLTGPVVGDPRLWAAAANEVLAAASIVSPHVERYFEPVDLQSFKFLVGEDLHGETLDQRLAAGRFPFAEACRLVRLAAVGLAQMHQCGRMHGDVRPASILLEAGQQLGNVKLLFDATQSPGPVDFTQQQPGSRLLQMADYLAPELMTPGRAPDPQTDVYALGCTLYTLLAGTPPFAGGHLQHKMTRHATEAIRPLEMFGVPQPVGQIAAYMMAKNPAVRFPSAAIVAEQLAAFVDPASLYAQPPPAPATLGSFEHYLRHQQARLAQPAAAMATVVVKAVKPAAAVAPSGPTAFRSDREHLKALAGEATSAGPAAGPGLNVAPRTRPSVAPDEIVRRREADQRRNVIVALVVAGVVATVGIVAFNMSRGNRPVAQAGNTKGTEQPPVTSVTPTSANVPSSTGKTPENGKTSSGGSGATTMPPVSPTKAVETKGPPAAVESGATQDVVADDGQLLWASPTAGPPLSFRGVPPEAQLIVAVRPADILAAPEGERVLQALGPMFAAQRTAFEAAVGLKLNEIEQLIVALHNNDAKYPRASFVVKTKEAIAREQLLAKWGNPAATQEKSQTYYAGAKGAYFISAAPEDQRTFTFGEARDVKDVAADGGAAPAMFREMERLRRTTDSQRHFTLLLYPQFLFNDDGEPLFAGERAKIRKPLAWLLGENLQAAAVSGHFGGEFYFELRMLSSLDKRPLQLAEELKGRLNQMPAALEDYFVQLNPPAYWKKLAFRYPGMIRDLHGQMRVGVESEQALVNAVLPTPAAHNLVLGGELLVATAPGAAVAVGANPPPAAGPKTIADALQLKTSYSFDSQSLEFAMRDLAADVQTNLKAAEFGIKIIGPDLQNDGITRNQSIRDFKQEGQTVADILTALVLKANPIPGKSATDKEQKLIWVVGPDPDNPAKQLVLITTRAAAANKKYTLPAHFVLK